MSWLSSIILAGALCVNHHPAKRSDHVTYGGLPPLAGYQRDHVIPLCLGGTDTRDNIQYQPWVEAHAKDQIEWQVCEAYCSGEITLKTAIQKMHDWKNY